MRKNKAHFSHNQEMWKSFTLIWIWWHSICWLLVGKMMNVLCILRNGNFLLDSRIIITFVTCMHNGIGCIKSDLQCTICHAPRIRLVIAKLVLMHFVARQWTLQLRLFACYVLNFVHSIQRHKSVMTCTTQNISHLWNTKQFCVDDICMKSTHKANAVFIRDALGNIIKVAFNWRSNELNISQSDGTIFFWELSDEVEKMMKYVSITV